MIKNKELMDKYIKQEAAQTFILFYKLMTGEFKTEELSEENKVISTRIKNECTDKNGDCYRLFQEIEKIHKTKNIIKLSKLYECILQILC